MYVIAKYVEDSKHPVMDMFRNHLCSIDMIHSGTVCHTNISDEAFSAWYATNKLGELEWKETELELVCDSAIVIAGKKTELDGILLYVAEKESVVSTTQAKACGLWSKILDSIYQDAHH
tara:strand:+ start:1194 stop:1550 length:357 start_codon:yes stop_codon:yes gene_type:complete